MRANWEAVGQETQARVSERGREEERGSEEEGQRERKREKAYLGLKLRKWRHH